MSGEQRNVLGGRLQSCSHHPRSGFMYTVCFHTSHSDPQGHTVCARMTQEFLDRELQRDNDLVTPVEAFAFPGLKVEDRWCICADVWLKAYEEGAAPPVCLEATNKRLSKSCRSNFSGSALCRLRIPGQKTWLMTKD